MLFTYKKIYKNVYKINTKTIIACKRVRKLGLIFDIVVFTKVSRKCVMTSWSQIFIWECVKTFRWSFFLSINITNVT